MELHKTALPSLFSVKSIVTFYHVDVSKLKRVGDWHDFPELCYVERGRHQVLVDGELFELSEGQAIIYAPNAYHIGSGAPSNAIVDIVSFGTDFFGLSSICNRVITLDESQKRQLSAIMTLGLDMFSSIPKDSGEKGMCAVAGTSELDLMKLKSRLELLLLEIYTKCGELPSGDISSNHSDFASDELNLMRSFLRENLGRVLTQDEIALHCSVSVSKLKRLCREQLGCGPITYFMALKLGEAKKLICNSSKNFSEIAEALGFGSIHHFSKFFKEKTGLTPSEYARSIYKK
jgi:AraC-like DNA-binding protein